MCSQACDQQPPQFSDTNEAKLLSERLLSAKKIAEKQYNKVRTGLLVDALAESGPGTLLLLFAAPMALPIPVPPGINIVLALPLLILTAQQAFGRHKLWVPKTLKETEVSKDKILILFNKMIPAIQKTERLVRPCFSFIINRNESYRLFGFLGFVMGLAVCVPLPLTNTIPSLGLSLIGAGLTMKNGLLVLLGALIGIAWVSMLTALIVIFGPAAFDIVRDAVHSLLP